MLLANLGIEATQRGEQWWAPCPNHEEKEGSWTIRDRMGQPLNGVHHCFGCKFKGTAVDLVADMIGISWLSAADWIKEKHLVGVATPKIKVRIDAKPLMQPAFKLPRETIVKPFSDWPSAPKRYLEGRFIDSTQADKWSLCFALTGRLQGRIIIPVLNHSGVIRSYTARTYIDDVKRYLEPHSSENADLSAIFGEVDWPDTDRSVIVVTEGAFNGLAVERTGLGLPFGALQGSQITPMQIAKLATFKSAIVLTDPDLAGDRANEFIRQALSRHVPHIRIKLPVKKDADSIPREDLTNYLMDALKALNEVKPV